MAGRLPERRWPNPTLAGVWPTGHLLLAALSALITLSVMSRRGLTYTASCKMTSYFSASATCLHDAVGAIEHLLQLFLLAGVEVFLELAALALEFAVLVHQLALARLTLALGSWCWRLALEALGRALERQRRRRRSRARGARTPAPAWPAPPWPASASRSMPIGVHEADAHAVLRHRGRARRSAAARTSAQGHGQADERCTASKRGSDLELETLDSIARSSCAGARRTQSAADRAERSS
jgi:hypothetical protein